MRIPGVFAKSAGRYLVQSGGPFAPSWARGQLRARLLRAFLDLAAEEDREMVAIQLQGADAAGYRTGRAADDALRNLEQLMTWKVTSK